MKELLFLSILDKNDYMGEEDIQEYFKKDITTKAIKKGYPTDTKFRLALQNIEVYDSKYVICFVFSDSISEEDIRKLEVNDLIKNGLILLHEELEILETNNF